MVITLPSEIQALFLCPRRDRRRAGAERPAMTSEEALQQGKEHGLTLLAAGNTTGYFGVRLVNRPGTTKPYEARVRRGGKQVSLGCFATAEQAALCVARSPEGQHSAAEAVAAAQPLTGEEALQQAQAEGLTLLEADNTTGYYGVSLVKPGRPKPYQARVRHGGRSVSLGLFATVEEAALCIAQSPGRKATAAERAAAAVAATDRVAAAAAEWAAAASEQKRARDE